MFLTHFHSSHGREDQWIPLPENSSPAQYATVIEKFFLVTLRCLNGHTSNYVIPLTTVQSDAGHRFFQALLGGAVDVMDRFHQFAWSLVVVQNDIEDAAEWTCPFLCYFPVLALRDDGNFMSPDDYSGVGAKLKYFCNNAAIFQADVRSASHPRGMMG